MSVNELFSILKGGPKSGNFGHSGRPGHEGGSGKGGGVSVAPVVKKSQVQKPVTKDTMMDQFSQWEKGLSNDERSALSQWGGGGGQYKQINSYLRSNEATRKHVESSRTKVHKVLVERAKLIEKALNKGQLGQDTPLFRASNIPALDPRNVTIGTKFKDSGFTATTIEKKYAKKFTGYLGKDNYIIKINAKKGQKGAFMDKVRDLQESEFLLPQNATFTVTKVNQESRTIEVDIE